jgi:hypothetical protein
MTNNTLQLSNIDDVKRVYIDSNLAKAIFDYMASRPGDEQATTVERLREIAADARIAASRGEARHLLRTLAQLGCGRFLVGRRGQDTRIKWKVSTSILGKAAKNAGSDIAEKSKDMSVTYPLRPDREVALALPKDLTVREANRLADFIKTLPFEDSRRSEIDALWAEEAERRVESLDRGEVKMIPAAEVFEKLKVNKKA